MDFIYHENWPDFSVNIYLSEVRDGAKFIYGQKDGHIIQQQLNVQEPLQKIEPLLTLNQYLAEHFLKAVADYLSGRDIKTDNEHLLQGKLAATEKHLEDMRQHFTTVLNKLVT